MKMTTRQNNSQSLHLLRQSSTFHPNSLVLKIPVHVAHLDLEDAAPELQAHLFRLNVTGRKELVFDIFGEILAKLSGKYHKEATQKFMDILDKWDWNAATQRS